MRGVSRLLAGIVVLTAAGLGCQPAPAIARPVVVPGTDYAFQLPAELPAGPTGFQFANRGKVPHEWAHLAESDAK